MNNRYRFTITILLAALLGGGNATAGVTVKGSVFGGGNQADVQTNTTVIISAGAVEGNVYGGGNLGDVGTHADQDPASTGNYIWKDQDGDSISANTADDKMTGVCKVIISGGTIGTDSPAEPKEHGNVFGGGKGSATTFECEKGMVYNTNVSINTTGTIVKGNVYGGGEVSRVENNTVVEIGIQRGTDEPEIIGNVFGAGAGKETHGYSALVRGTSSVTVQGKAKVLKNVYGGGELASVGRYKVKTPANENDDDVPDELPYGMPARLISGGTSTVIIQDNAVIGSTGSVATTGHVYGAGKGLEPNDYDYVTQEQFEGDDYIEDDHKPKRMVSGNTWEYFADTAAYLQFVETLALSAETDVTITGDATITGSVFGGSESGFVYHNTDVKIQNGTVNGSAYGGGRGLVSYAEAGRVRGNTQLTISDGAVHGNVYGGGNLGDVGTINKSDQTNYNYVWKNSEANGNINAEGKGNTAGNNAITGTNKNTGICKVTISGGTIGTGVTASAEGTYADGNVFGAGQGSNSTWWCEKAIVFATEVKITGGIIQGSVYGGGQLGRVEDDTKVTIGEDDAPAITGNVFGAGAGINTHGYSALVRGNSLVTIQSTSTVGGSVYGGGEIASVGRFNVVGGLPKDPLSGGTCQVTITGDAVITGDVFGACKGVTPAWNNTQDDVNRSKSMQLYKNRPEDNSLWSHYNDDDDSPFIWRFYATEADYLAFLETLALTSNTEVTISGNATVNKSVYGGGQRGVSLGSVTVNMTGGTVTEDIYGGGALAHTNKGNWNSSADYYIKANGLTAGTTSVNGLYTKTDDTYTPATGKAVEGTDYYSRGAWADDDATSSTYTTNVILTGGTVSRVFGGALGDDDNRAKVYGDILVVLNGTVANNGTITRIADTIGCIVDYIFGANNLYGTPMGKVKVQVEATQSKVLANDAINIKTDVGDALEGATDNSRYDVLAVYGGGNLSAYEPFDASLESIPANKGRIDAARTSVIINGCDYTSIKQVYGGGNAASVAAAHVQVNGTHEINEVFGGGNGNDPYTLDNLHYNNPGANVGYYNYTHWGNQTGDEDHPFVPIDNTDASTLEQRRINYQYGSGIATTEIYGGLIHSVYGGSNSKGNIRQTAISTYEDMDDDCPVTVDETYGGGKNAPMDGEIQLKLDCVKNMPIIFGGAKNADVNSDIELNITNGSFDKVFGGNNEGGAIYGSITVNIEEKGCQPIYINELYGGGYFAPYSIYGYKKDAQGNYNYSDGKLIPLESASDNTQPDASRTPSNDPQINIISATKINKVFGGGYEATMVGSPHVNVNMKAGKIVNVGNDYAAGEKTAKKPDKTDYTYTVTSVETDEEDENKKNAILAIGSIGNVYGGGYKATVVGDTYVELGTNASDNTAIIEGNVFGGGDQADVTGNTNIYIAAQEVTVDENNEWQGVTADVNIGGNVFGGGKGIADSFTCEKAMVGIDGDGINHPDGGTTIIIGNGTIEGSVYGGGEIGRVEKNTLVKIGLGEGSLSSPVSTPIVKHDVFGGGKGLETHGYAALVRGNPTVIIKGNAKVNGSVYGGGEIASVARYKVAQTPEEAQEHGVSVDMPYVLFSTDNPSGNCTVTVGGYAEIGPDGMQMTNPDGPDNTGHVFGAGKGILPKIYDYSAENDEHKPKRMVLNGDKTESIWEWFVDEDHYIAFIQTLALATQTNVTIGGNAFVKGSVYGGSQNGLVQFNTNVTIQDNCQIGEGFNNGSGVGRYTKSQWAGEDPDDFYECASWEYGVDTDDDGKDDLFAPYDPNANATGDLDKYSSEKSTEGGRRIASDGHTFYGNVFGGGSGSTPYFKDGISSYLHSAGLVKGNTNVLITGGHILTNVYGGCEATNVLDSAKVIMTGGTIGVPRTNAQIIAHPVTGYLFGGGKGDQRIFFNKDTNVKDAIVEVEGGTIYGSVYGGGEDGHVLRNVLLTISETDATNHPTRIGTTGTSYYDGHVFGGGRGFGGEALTAGNVGGSVELKIEGGIILGSVYGGGRMASVGYGLYLVDEVVDEGQGRYGEMRPDDEYDGSYEAPSTEPAEDFYTLGRGHIIMNISGGTIGNDYEYTYQDDDTLTHTKGGNVFAGGMGSFYKQDGTTPLDWRMMGKVKTTRLTISDDAIIKSNVYGGGELGQVTDSTGITITGGTIGTEIKNNGTTQYTFGSVFGGGYGSDMEELTVNAETTKPKLEAGIIKGNTHVTMTGGTVKASVYGGGEMASVGDVLTKKGSSFVTISDGQVGIDKIQINDNPVQYRYFGGATMGNVYGGGSGLRNTVRSGRIIENATVNISGGTIYHNVYGGGAFGTVGDFEYNEELDSQTQTTKVSGITGLNTPGTGIVNINISGNATIGTDGHENGMVFGSSRGEVAGNSTRDDLVAWVYDANVTIGTQSSDEGPQIKGSVYGSGENGHTWNNTNITLNSGTIGIEDDPSYPNRGNIYGGGCGTDMYDSDDDGDLDSYNNMAGIVLGNTTVNIEGGTVVHNIYGGGAMGSVGQVSSIGSSTNGGKAIINITNGTIGVSGTVGDGNVYGASRGDLEATVDNLAQVKETEINIGDADDHDSDPKIWGNVFGGGEAGIVKQDVNVTVSSGTIVNDVYGGGALAHTNIDNWDSGTWATGIIDPTDGTTQYKTAVNLNGGVIGNAYGGALGRLESGTEGESDYISPVEAMVYGDVTVNLAGASLPPVIDRIESDTITIYKGGRVFGGNNMNGTPKGKVTILVTRTENSVEAKKPKDIEKTLADRYRYYYKGKDESNIDSIDVAAVYGGGNQSDYEPVTNQAPWVIVDGCNDVSIGSVYGGGNAAAVPATNVEIRGAYFIQYVFGGGFGAGTGNRGANVGYKSFPEGITITDDQKINYVYDSDFKKATTVNIYGGYIDNAFGGSDTKGDIYGTGLFNISDLDNGCALRIGSLYGGGRKATQNGDVNTIIDCPSSYISAVYGGSEMADIHGNINLTITAGSFENVFGGNRKSGIIDGYINVNIEETATGCQPIYIDNLYGGCDEAPYSGALNPDGYNVIVNVKSFTRIGTIFGGSKGVNANLIGNTIINLNQTLGHWAGKHYPLKVRNAQDELVNNTNPNDSIPNQLGEVGNIYGGGDLAEVDGNTTINIGTETLVGYITEPVHLRTEQNTPISREDNAEGDTLYYVPVDGANITGNVFGGGNLADVTGNTYVNIGSKKVTVDDTEKWQSVQVGSKGLTIGGNVFGGGKGKADSFRCEKAMVGVDGAGAKDENKDGIPDNPDGGTSVIIGNGTIGGNVYGGGEVGRVEKNTLVIIGLGTSAPVINGNVFAAGKGVSTHGYSALVRGNTSITVQANAKVMKSVYGGGEIASVGRYQVADSAYHDTVPEVQIGMPYSLANNYSGKCVVRILGNAEIGPNGMQMHNTVTGKPDDTGHVFGAGKGILPYEDTVSGPKRMTPANDWEIYTDTLVYLDFIESLALTTETDVLIGGNSFIKGSVYGGSENGRVQHDTHVTIQDSCQIGNGDGINCRYTADEWNSESLTECAHWEYNPATGSPYDPYAEYESDGKYYYDADATIYAEGGSKVATDGHTYYGNVFGGGSGVVPYAPGKWHRAAGAVGGNITVDITGGHILTNLYGGNEHTDVGSYAEDSLGNPIIPVKGGKITINMVGGTLGLPRTDDQIAVHPVTGYIFGAGKGDQRIFFNTWTNVIETEVNVSGNARIFGSTFGGGEDGHVIYDAITNIGDTVTIGETEYPYDGALIGTRGTSYVDGNIFGGGRGFSGVAQTAGTVGGNVYVNIYNGTMLGSIYGGGRLASVGSHFAQPSDIRYGNLIDDETEGSNPRTFGHITVNITGGTIGNELGNSVSGNVFGGSMGRVTLLNGSTNPIWPKMAQAKTSEVNISGSTVIKRSVYGGGEFGTLRDSAVVNITGGTIERNVFGGGYGSDDFETKTIIRVKEPEDYTNPSADYVEHRYKFTPMIFAGSVGQATHVNISGGWIKKNVYGGGEMASVGIINCLIDENDDYVYNHVHDEEDNDFTLSWPYHFVNVPGFFGATHINITGGRLGITGKDVMTVNGEKEDNGDVFGASKGKAGNYLDYIFLANVGSTDVRIAYPTTSDPSLYKNDGSDCITGSVYGGAEDGHVMGNTKLTLEGGLVGNAIYGGGKGKGTFTTELKKIKGVTVLKNNAPEETATAPVQPTDSTYEAKIYSITAGKIFGNTEVVMTGGYVVRNVYGGGNMGSVGIGNYAGGLDDYSIAGYGETLNDNLWDSVNVKSQQFLSTGKATVKILGGSVGYVSTSTPEDYINDGLPYGNVFGGCRGESAPNIGETPRYLYSPAFYSGYVNETEVIIGKTDGTGPTIRGSVYGGGQDGHVRRDTKVTVNAGEIGVDYNGDGTNLNNAEWLHSGNVYGAGSGIGQYQYDFNYDGDYEDSVSYYNPSTKRTTNIKESDYSTSAGSVTRFTTVKINSGTIHRNVYGGGSLSSVGAPKIPPTRPDDPLRRDDSDTINRGKQSLNEVIITGGTIGGSYSYDANGNHVYGGHVFGASRGLTELDNTFSTSNYTSVTVSDTAHIYADVYGGGENGDVKNSVDVNIYGGTIGHDVYGGGALANTNTSNWNLVTGNNWANGMLLTDGGIDRTKYNTKVNILGGTIGTASSGGEVYGGGLGRLGDNPVAAMVYGDVLVNFNGIESTDYNESLHDSLVSPVSSTEYMVRVDSGMGAVVNRIFGANNLNGMPKGHVKVHVYATRNRNKSTISDKFSHPFQNDKDHEDETPAQYLARTIAAAKPEGNLISGLSAETVTNAETVLSTYNSAAATYSTKCQEYDASLTIEYSSTEAATEAQATAYNAMIDAEATLNTALESVNTAIGAMDRQLSTLYDVQAVYGGGNLAAYIYGNGEKIENTEANQARIAAARTEVIIDGCDYTSIYNAYGGGNAAPVSGTLIQVNGTYEIFELFGGGNGIDDYQLNGAWYENPGANVGYLTYATHSIDESVTDRTYYKATDNSDAANKDQRESKYGFGSGIATTEVRGGKVHAVYGGSNKKGNIRTTALSVYEEALDDCPINVDETYGGGKDAPMDGEIDLSLDCVKDMEMIFGGAKNAEINSNITLNITNGTFKKVFGGNNLGGAVNGSITVNVEEKGCVPIVIDELYGGGYLAPYSKYGYEKDADNNYVYYKVDDNNRFIPKAGGGYQEGTVFNGKLMPLEAGQTGASDTPSKDLRINIISATRIGTIYGGGYKAKVVADTHVNVNMQDGRQYVYLKEIDDVPTYVDANYDFSPLADNTGHIYPADNVVRDTVDNKDYITLDRGTIGTIYGGGFEADVAGDTYIEIGTGEWLNDSLQREMIGYTNDIDTTTFTYLAATEKWSYIDGDDTLTISNKPTPIRNEAVITGNVFGGGDNADITGNTNIDIANGHIYFNVYGGGKMGSVGTVTDTVRHDNVEQGFALSWPYDVTYREGTGVTNINITGGRFGFSGKDVFEPDANGIWTFISNDKDSVKAKEGRKRLDNGDIFGGGMGEAGNRYEKALVANVKETHVTVDYGSTPTDPETVTQYNKDNIQDGITGSVYGGAEDGHVYGDTYVTINGGMIGHAVYGGGKGKGQYETVLIQWKDEHGEALTDSARIRRGYYNTDPDTGNPTTLKTLDQIDEIDAQYKDTLKIYSIGAGKVYGNTNITMTDGYVVRNIFGGGNLGSVGKGNYSGGYDDYTYLAPNWVNLSSDIHVGYGETVQENLWTENGPFKTSGISTVFVKGGTVGTADGEKDDLPTGNVFGGCRGIAVPNVPNDLQPRYLYCPEFYLGYVNEAIVIIGDSVNPGTGPRLFGSVYGGGQDGHVRRETNVTVWGGEIGNDYSTMTQSYVTETDWTGVSDEEKDSMINAYSDMNSLQWLHRGNVMGAGSGIGKYDKDGDEEGDNYCTAAGSVTHRTIVNIKSGKIHRDVYGGGSLATVGPPKMGQQQDISLPEDKGYTDISSRLTNGWSSITIVNIESEVGDAASASLGYGGEVFGASRGANATERLALEEGRTYAANNYSLVNIKEGANVHGNVFGGGEAGTVYNDTKINIANFDGAQVSSATIGKDVFGGGDEADVLGNTTINIGGGHIKHNVYGGGNIGSIGTIDDTKTVEHRGRPASYDNINYTNDGGLYDFALSWPVKLEYKPNTGDTHINITGGRIGTSGDDNGDVFGAGKGSMGIDWEALNIDLESNDVDMESVINAIDNYRYQEQMSANVNNTYVTVNIESPATLDEVARVDSIWDTDDHAAKPKFLIDATYSAQVIPGGTTKDYEHGGFTGFGNTNVITGSVYGGSENGHVIGNTSIEMTDGIIGHAIYGGGKGKETYRGKLYNLQNAMENQYLPNYVRNPDFSPILNSYAEDLYSLTAGKVYGNTHIVMKKGFVIRNVYGGGNLGSIGKGNYSGGRDDYSQIGYGERTESNQYDLWTTTSYNPEDDSWNTSTATLADYFMSSGKTLVEILGGQIGYILPAGAGSQKDIEKVARKDDLPTGNVFGACRGQTSPNGNVQPYYLYIPDFYLGYVNESKVIIGDGTGDGPKILGSVYGGGQDGHVRRNTNVIINNATIGVPYSDIRTSLGKTDSTDLQFRGRGNVFGAGSGIGTYKIKVDGHETEEEDYNYTSGSVTANTNIEINDKANGKTIIYQNIYGGGSLASVGPPVANQVFNEFNTLAPYPATFGREILTHKSTSSTNVIINGGTIGDAASYTNGINYGGNVFGASRGNLPGKTHLNLGDETISSRYATSIWTNVEARNGHIFGNVFGGGESGAVKMDTKVILGGLVPDATSGNSGDSGNDEPGSGSGSGSGAPLRAPSGNRSTTSTPANVATEAPVNRSITTRQAQ